MDAPASRPAPHNNELALYPSSDGVRGPTGEISMEESEMNHAVSMGRRIKLALALGILFGFALPVELSAQVVGATVSGRVQLVCHSRPDLARGSKSCFASCHDCCKNGRFILENQ
jgi:hypothetical protein